MEIKSVNLHEIRPYFNNPRDNSRAVAPTMESIKRYGFVKPILVDNNGVIIAGHTRFLAAIQLGLEQVPVLYSDMSSEKAKLFRIADNKLAEKSVYDEDLLIEELKKLEMPADMQSFFFEDLGDMLNFDASSPSFSAPMDNESDFTPNPFGNPYEEENEEIPSEEPKEPSRRPFEKYLKEDGYYVTYVCPYCGCVEEVKL